MTEPLQELEEDDVEPHIWEEPEPEEEVVAEREGRVTSKVRSRKRKKKNRSNPPPLNQKQKWRRGKSQESLKASRRRKSPKLKAEPADGEPEPEKNASLVSEQKALPKLCWAQRLRRRQRRRQGGASNQAWPASADNIDGIDADLASALIFAVEIAAEQQVLVGRAVQPAIALDLVSSWPGPQPA